MLDVVRVVNLFEKDDFPLRDVLRNDKHRRSCGAPNVAVTALDAVDAELFGNPNHTDFLALCSGWMDDSGVSIAFLMKEGKRKRERKNVRKMLISITNVQLREGIH